MPRRTMPDRLEAAGPARDLAGHRTVPNIGGAAEVRKGPAPDRRHVARTAHALIGLGMGRSTPGSWKRTHALPRVFTREAPFLETTALQLLPAACGRRLP
jgi:hypothetical protein